MPAINSGISSSLCCTLSQVHMIYLVYFIIWKHAWTFKMKSEDNLHAHSDTYILFILFQHAQTLNQIMLIVAITQVETDPPPPSPPTSPTPEANRRL